ncbi:MAG: hypothetical protein NTV30_06580 [Chloroflexi bacterium]|nr:hypothetical protein [Chloroflexota bacterium]
MKIKLTKLINILIILAMIISVSAFDFSCTEEQGAVVLTVVKGDTTKTYDVKQLQKLTAITGKSNILTSAGEVVGPVDITGADIIDRCRYN